MDTAAGQLKKSRAFFCLECGKCTAVCPISRYNNSYSPRRLVAQGLFHGTDELIDNPLLWSCLTCQLCSQRCPVDVKFSDFMRDVRTEAHRQGKHGNASHQGALLHVMEMSANAKLKPKRNGWIDKSMKVAKRGDVMLFVGCLPYFEDFFAKDFGYSPLSVARDAVKILNHLGIEPVVSDNERCCGHDLYWLGNMESFDDLARINLKEIELAQAKTVVTACAECALSLKKLYPERLGANGFEVKHITEFVAENLDKMRFKEVEAEVTFQDPCRLGRYLQVYDAPRDALQSIPGLTISEMPHNRQGAICCGTTNWMNCDATSRQIQHNRLAEAKATGAKTLVTACPKCRIHFQCSECGDETDKVDIEIADFTNIVASALQD